jgi:hypothetical protein
VGSFQFPDVTALGSGSNVLLPTIDSTGLLGWWRRRQKSPEHAAHFRIGRPI